MNIIISAITIESLVMAIITIIGLGLVFGLLGWLINKIQLAEPWNYAANAGLAIAAVLILICIIMSVIGHPLIQF